MAVLVNPTNPATSEATLRDVGLAARALGLQIKVLNASTSREIDAAFTTFVASGPTPSSSAPTLLHQPAYPVGPPGDTPQDPRDILGVYLQNSAG